MAIEIKKAKDIIVGENYVFRSLVYGATGSGKSWAIRTMPKPVFVIDTDNGMLTNRGVEGIDYFEVPFHSGIGLPKGWAMIEEGIKYFIENKEKYRALCLDSLTTLSSAAMEYTLFVNHHQGQPPTLPDYNQEKMRVEEKILALLGTGRHLYITAHEEFTKNEVTGQIWCLPIIRGQLQPIIGKWFDEVYHARVKKDKDGKPAYMWLVRADVMYRAKSRLANSPSVEEEQPQDFVGYARKCGVELK